jgi:protein-L-isoaspartate(D-aspartate) O-methyltransferase
MARAPSIVFLVFASLLGAEDLPDRSDERLKMVRTQIERRGVEDTRTLKAMRTVPRHLFVPSSVRSFAYDDRPLPIGFGQTISQPYIVAYMTELLEPEPGMKVLEIGTGSGYQAAILAATGAEVWSIEIVEPLAERAAKALSAAGLGSVHLRHGDGYFGWKEAGPFDAIIVTAAASTIPPPLIEQIAEGGRMIIPVGPALGDQYLVLVTVHEGKARTRRLIPVRFVPFTREDDD